MPPGSALAGVTRNNLRDLGGRFSARRVHQRHRRVGVGEVEPGQPGVGGTGGECAGTGGSADEEEEGELLERAPKEPRVAGSLPAWRACKRLVVVDQKAIGRTPRSNLATYTGLFDHVRKIFADTKAARARRYDAGRFSFNVAKGRCEHCQGEGFVMVELLFLASVYTPCPVCHGARYNAKTLEIKYRDKTIADVLGLTVDAAWDFFADEETGAPFAGGAAAGGPGLPAVGSARHGILRRRGATHQAGDRTPARRHGARRSTFSTNPRPGLHPADVEKLMAQLDGLVDAGNTVIVVEHDMRVAARSDWVIDIGPGAGDEGGRSRRRAHRRKCPARTGAKPRPIWRGFWANAFDAEIRGDTGPDYRLPGADLWTALRLVPVKR